MKRIVYLALACLTANSAASQTVGFTLFECTTFQACTNTGECTTTSADYTFDRSERHATSFLTLNPMTANARTVPLDFHGSRVSSDGATSIHSGANIALILSDRTDQSALATMTIDGQDGYTVVGIASCQNQEAGQ